MFGFIQQGGTAPYRPLCSRFYIAGGDGSLLSPVFGFIYHGGTALYRPLCSALRIQQGGDDSVPFLVLGFV